MAIPADDYLKNMQLSDELRDFFNQSSLALEILRKHTITISVDPLGRIKVDSVKKPEPKDIYEGLENVGGLGCHGPGGFTIEQEEIPDHTPK